MTNKIRISLLNYRYLNLILAEINQNYYFNPILTRCFILYHMINRGQSIML